MNSSLLRSEPIAIFLMIGSSRSAADPCDVLRGDGGVVDDHAGGLGAGPAGGGADVVDRRGRELRQRGDVVEQGEQAAAHRGPARSAVTRAAYRGVSRRRGRGGGTPRRRCR